MLHYKIIAGSSANIPGIPNDSIHFAVTSPPYLDVKAYDRDNPENIGNYKLEKQLDMLKPVYSEIFRILQPGRKFVVNVPDMISISPIDGKICHIPVHYETIKLLNEIGFVWESPYTWNKMHSRSAASSGSFPYPVGVVLVHDFEAIAVMRKPGEVDYSHISKEEREASKMSSEFMRDAMYNSINMMGETQVDFHIAAYPVELVDRFIRLYSYVGETVYDPFLGSGTTMISAKKLARSGIGCEIGFKTPDGIPWIEHVKKRVGWNDGSVVGEQVLYEIINPQGEVIDSSVVAGRGKLNAKELLEAQLGGETLFNYKGDGPEVNIDVEPAIKEEPKERKKKEPEVDDRQGRLF
jgi:DNA modification methylase